MAFAKVMIIGNLGRDPEMRYTPNGRPVTEFSVAVSHRSRDPQTGEWADDQTDWYRVTVWGDRAERTAEQFRKGNKVFVEGRFRTKARLVPFDPPGRARLGTLGPGLAHLPAVVGHHPEDADAAQGRQGQSQVVHAQPASTMVAAVSMSTATMRDTPCSCIVTPISCLAISIAILLWLMNRNCVPCDIFSTSLA